MARDDDDWQLGVCALDDRQHLEAIEPAALQPDVENDELRPPLLDDPQRFVAVARQSRAVPLVFENARYKLANIRFVIDNQDVCSHCSQLLVV